MSTLVKSLGFVLTLVCMMMISAFVVKATEPVVVHVLGRDDCGHCQAEKAYFKELSEQRNDFRLEYLDIAKPENLMIWEAVTATDGVARVTPITLIGTTLTQGFGGASTTGATFERLIDNAKGSDQWTFQEYIDQKSERIVNEVKGESCDDNCQIEPLLVTIPILGVVDAKQYSLGIMAFLLGLVDGFNPCAMWVLVTFLLILMQVGSRRKMWLFVGIFLMAEAIMYALILTVWYQTWDFIGLDRLVTPIVGLIAIGAGTFFLWEWKTSKPGECKVTNLESRQKIQNKIKSLASQNISLAVIIGIVMLAFSVNVIEFACSIGIPQAFTKILQMNQLPFLSMSFYVFVYIIAYMIDDFIVFGIALISFEKIGITTKYSKIANFIGGVLMILLGLGLIFQPEWLQL